MIKFVCDLLQIITLLFGKVYSIQLYMMKFVSDLLQIITLLFGKVYSLQLYMIKFVCDLLHLMFQSYFGQSIVMVIGILISFSTIIQLYGGCKDLLMEKAGIPGENT
jgi:hypothetical protein